MSEIWFANNNYVYEKVCDKGQPKMLFFNFLPFSFFHFQMTIVKNLLEKLAFFEWISKVLMKFYFLTNIFHPQIFDNESTALLKLARRCILFI